MFARMSPRRTRSLAALAVVLGTATPAAAWTPDMHRSIVEIALAVSPEASSRVPGYYRHDLLRGVTQADAPIATCGWHIAPTDGADEVDKLVGVLQRTATEKWSTNRSLVIGRICHIAADASIPSTLENGQPRARAEMFSGVDFAVFRDPVLGAAEPLGAGLKRVRRLESFADSTVDEDSARFRRAVNLVIDALMRLPVAEPPAETGGRTYAVFLLDRLDSGLSGSRVTGRTYVGSDATYSPSRERTEYTARYEDHLDKSTAGAGKRRFSAVHRDAAEPVEWRSHTAGGKTAHRVVVFNNTAQCGRSVSIQGGSFKRELPFDLPSRSFRLLEFETPSSVARASIKLEFRGTGPCGPAADRVDAVRVAGFYSVAATATGEGPSLAGLEATRYPGR